MGAEEEKAGCEARPSAPCLDSGEGRGRREKKEEKEQPPDGGAQQVPLIGEVGGAGLNRASWELGEDFRFCLMWMKGSSFDCRFSWL